MKIAHGTLRYRDGSTVDPQDLDYDSHVSIALERFDKVTRSFILIEKNLPLVLDNTGSELPQFKVYLDGLIVPWWEHADRVRGFVDLWADSSEPQKHRLFGCVTFRK